MEIRPGDFVSLQPREKPHAHPADWSWQVTAVGDGVIDCAHWSGSQVIARRFGVPLRDVIQHRRDDA